MKKNLVLLIAFLIVTLGCSGKKGAGQADDTALKKLRQAVAEGHYEEGLKIAKEISSQVPPGPFTEEALYLQGYILAYGKTDFHNARLPLKHLLDFYPNGATAPAAHKLLADCQYWQGHYRNAGREYKKLLEAHGEKGLAGYAQIQMANCLLLDDKVGDALTAYRELVEKQSNDPIADSAQLMIANTYLKLQNWRQAKSELQKLMSFTRNKEIQQSAQKTLRQMEQEEPFRKGVGVPE